MKVSAADFPPADIGGILEWERESQIKAFIFDVQWSVVNYWLIELSLEHEFLTSKRMLANILAECIHLAQRRDQNG